MVSAPENEAQAWDLASQLAELAAAERADKLQGQRAGTPTQQGWLSFATALLSPGPEQEGSGPSAKRLIAIAHSLGYADWEAHETVARFASLAPVQEAWSNWVTVADRNELRLRLELAGGFDQLDERLVPFLLFFFRASDPGLYQAAAISAGKHTPKSLVLAQEVTRYASERAVRLDAPVSLMAQRVRRRVLLALTGACSTGASALANGQALPGLPLTLGDGEQLLEGVAKDAADLATALLSLVVLSRSPHYRQRVMDICQRVLGELPALDPVLINRRTFECWGKLFVSCHTDHGNKLTVSAGAQVWRKMLERELRDQQSRATDDFAGRVASLLRLDELCRAIVLVEREVFDSAVGQAARELHAEDQMFLFLRMLTWMDRQPPLDERRGAIEHALTSLAPQTPSPFLRSAWQALHDKTKPPSALLGAESARTTTAFLGLLMQRLESRERWLATDAPTRALAVFLLLDQTQHPEVPTEQLNALMAQHGLDSPSRAIATRATSRETQVAGGNNAVPVVLRVLVLEEQHEVEAFVDAQLLHQVEDPRVLLGLLPSHRESSLLPFLADAFEHQVRWRLRRDSDFDPYLLLYMTTIRDPHPAFFSHLKAVMANRTYQRASGEQEPLAEWVDTLAREVAAFPLGDRAAAGSDNGVSSQPNTRPPRTRSPLFGLMGRVRDQLLSMRGEHGDIRKELEAMTRLTGGTTETRPSGVDSLQGFLSLLHPAHQPMLQSGQHAWSPLTVESLRHEAATRLNAISHAAAALMPESWESSGNVEEAAGAIRTGLGELEALLAPVLPQVEEALLRTAISKLEDGLLAWAGGVEALSAAWQEMLAETRATGPAAWDALLSRASDAWTPPVRGEFVLRTWEFLQRHAAAADNVLEARRAHGGISAILRFWTILEAQRGSPAEGTDGWSRELALLDWGLETPVQSQWPQEEQFVWREAAGELHRRLLNQAMDSRWEARAIHLLTNVSYRPLRRLSTSAPILEAARTWCFDRYRLESARQVHQDLQAANGSKRVSRVAELWAFFLHFTPVWIGLMVGAFLMQDFGDAWTEMAREGDIRGITLTCIVGIGGAFAYMLVNLRSKVKPDPGYRQWDAWAKRLGRLGLFMVCSLIYTIGVTSFMWFLLSSTDEVVHGIGAFGHIAAWSGFALLVGTFFGLIAKNA